MGGIQANNTYPAEFIRDNLLIQTNVIDSAWRARRAASCCSSARAASIRKLAPQPMREEYLLTGPAGAHQRVVCDRQDRRHQDVSGLSASVWISTPSAPCRPISTGPGDNFSLQNSHVLPALIRKFHEARRAAAAAQVVVWGTGTPRREFLHVDDLAEAACSLMQHYDDEQLINVGSGEDLTILELAQLVARVVGFEGHIVLRSDANRMARRASCSMSRGSQPSAGGRRLRSRTVFVRRTVGLLKMPDICA